MVKKATAEILNKIRSLGPSQHIELTIEEAGILQTFLHKKYGKRGAYNFDENLLRAIKRVLTHWQRTYCEKDPLASATSDKRSQIALRTAIDKLRMKQYHSIADDELQLARATLDCLRGTENKSPGMTKVENLLSSSLTEYDRHNANIGAEQEEKKSVLGTIFWQNRYILGGLVVVLAIVGYMKTTQDNGDPGEKSGENNGPNQPVVVNRPIQKPRPTKEQKARKMIAEYQERLEQDPKSEDAPALLSAMGNIYFRELQDYENARESFESLLLDYPDWSNTRKIYPKLSDCYKKLGDSTNARLAYQRMLEVVPKDSSDHVFAEAQLNKGDF